MVQSRPAPTKEHASPAQAASSHSRVRARDAARPHDAHPHAHEHDQPAHGRVDRDRWSDVTPRGVYARFGRPLVQASLAACVLPPTLCLALPIALVNWILFRDVRRILFVQERVGLRGTRFRIYKFRTMREAPTSAHDSWSSGAEHARVTRFGKLLRNTHLDELPQLVNILKGDMNVIGPRPEMVEIEAWAGENIPGFSLRLAIKPGITGRAQITQGYTGRDVDAYARKLEINLHELRTVSLRGDLEIVWRTALWMLRGKGWAWKAPREHNAREIVPHRRA